MAGSATLAEAHGSASRSAVSNAQEQLKNDGYYNGRIDGIDGTMTHAAIRKYQRDNNLTVNGRLDRATRNKLGVQTTGEASRSAEPNESNQSGQSNPSSQNNQSSDANRVSNQNSSNSSSTMVSSATVSAAQRHLKKMGFYSGDVNGNMSSETRSAIREYQKNSNLNVTGQLDPATLSGLGVSK
jgi:peptidoglycan hydrolase-like protein with peptidoglycan-binding domain